MEDDGVLHVQSGYGNAGKQIKKTDNQQETNSVDP